MNTTGKIKVLHVTSKGQITLPIAWRRKIKTDMVILRELGDTIHIIPFYPNEQIKK